MQVHVGLNIWYTSLPRLIGDHWRGTCGYFLCFSLGDPASFESLKAWKETERKCTSEGTIVVLEGIKDGL